MLIDQNVIYQQLKGQKIGYTSSEHYVEEKNQQNA